MKILALLMTLLVGVLFSALITLFVISDLRPVSPIPTPTAATAVTAKNMHKLEAALARIKPASHPTTTTITTTAEQILNAFSKFVSPPPILSAPILLGHQEFTCPEGSVFAGALDTSQWAPCGVSLMDQKYAALVSLQTEGCPSHLGILSPTNCSVQNKWRMALAISPPQTTATEASVTTALRVEQHVTGPARLKGHGTLVLTNKGQGPASLTSIILYLVECSTNKVWSTVSVENPLVPPKQCAKNTMATTPMCYSLEAPCLSYAELPPGGGALVPSGWPTIEPSNVDCENAVSIDILYEFILANDYALPLPNNFVIRSLATVDTDCPIPMISCIVDLACNGIPRAIQTFAVESSAFSLPNIASECVHTCPQVKAVYNAQEERSITNTTVITYTPRILQCAIPQCTTTAATVLNVQANATLRGGPDCINSITQSLATANTSVTCTPPPLQPCTVSAWSDWTVFPGNACDSSTCLATYSRSRTIVREACYGAPPCPEAANLAENTTLPCTLPLLWTEWSDWSLCYPCPVGSSQSRQRSVRSSNCSDISTHKNQQQQQTCNCSSTSVLSTTCLYSSAMVIAQFASGGGSISSSLVLDTSIYPLWETVIPAVVRPYQSDFSVTTPLSLLHHVLLAVGDGYRPLPRSSGTLAIEYTDVLPPASSAGLVRELMVAQLNFFPPHMSSLTYTPNAQCPLPQFPSFAHFAGVSMRDLITMLLYVLTVDPIMESQTADAIANGCSTLFGLDYSQTVSSCTAFVTSFGTALSLDALVELQPHTFLSSLNTMLASSNGCPASANDYQRMNNCFSVALV